MSAAILQGVPATTLDTDLWVELPERSFVKLYAIVLEQGGVMLAPTVAALSDDSLINFLPHLDGVGSFETEMKRAKKLVWHGLRVPVLHLKSILASKRHLQRPKDIAHLPLIEQTLHLSDNR